MRAPQVLAVVTALGLSACTQVAEVFPPVNEASQSQEDRSGSRQTQQLVRPKPMMRTLPPWLRARGAEPLVAWEFAIEQELLRLTNAERQKAGLAPVALDTRLQSVARLHSLDQAGKNYSAHRSPDGKEPADRLRAAGIAFNLEGENIRWVSSRAPGTVANDMMYEGQYGWMNSPGHKANILNPNFTHVGIGVFKSSTDGKFIATQNFIQKP